MKNESSTLRELSDEATPGPYFLHDFTDPVLGPDPQCHDVTISCSTPDTLTVAAMDAALTGTLGEARANAAFFVRLANDYRAGRLIEAPRRSPLPPAEKPLGPQVRELDDTLSAFTVLRDRFSDRDAAVSKVDMA